MHARPLLTGFASLFLTLSALCAPPAAQAQSLPKLEALANQNVAISALVVDLSSRRIIGQVDPDQRLTPASVTKLFIDAASLSHWGPNHRFSTPLLTNGRIRNGSLHGNVMLVGRGDPGLGTEQLWTLVMRLRQMGVRSIEGNLVVNESLFGPIDCGIQDRCEALRATDSGYDAPISAAGSNYSTLEILVRPAPEIGQPAKLSLLPPALQYPLEGSISTAPPRNRPLYGVRRTTEAGQDTLHAYGKVPRDGGPYQVYRSVSDPARYTGDLLVALMEESGISLKGGVLVTSEAVPKEYVEIASTDSATLGEQMQTLMAYSNNYMSDLLTLDMAAEKNPSPRFTLAQASDVLEDFANDINTRAPAWLRAKRYDTTALTIESGSGLSITNKLSARDLVSLLEHMHSEFSLFPSFVGSLPVPRFAPSRMLRRNANRDWMTRLAVKTGYLSEPVSVLSLSGYFRLKDGGWGAFAVVTNGTQKRRRVSTSYTLGAIKSDLQALMTKY